MESIPKLVGDPISQESNIKDLSKGFLIVQNPENPENNRELTYAKLSQLYNLSGLIIVGNDNPPASSFITDVSLGQGNYFPIGTTYINNSVSPHLLWRLTARVESSGVVTSVTWTKIIDETRVNNLISIKSPDSEITVTESQQGDIEPSFSINTPSTLKTVNVKKGVTAKTASLKALIQELVNKSHTHELKTINTSHSSHQSHHSHCSAGLNC